MYIRTATLFSILSIDCITYMYNDKACWLDVYAFAPVQTLEFNFVLIITKYTRVTKFNALKASRILILRVKPIARLKSPHKNPLYAINRFYFNKNHHLKLQAIPVVPINALVYTLNGLWWLCR